ncbi:hypothetical protein OJAV_G00193910 [Oryzias javanicus]|uniref:Uncharacterized protein n=1 Tax=Oryzias javanicus TaxID=123683 RepID=A0A3S2LS74_ORYJA|nr:hypothetical protein OJAV_G00193910 [Oryzias javanicus]
MITDGYIVFISTSAFRAAGRRPRALAERRLHPPPLLSPPTADADGPRRADLPAAVDGKPPLRPAGVSRTRGPGPPTLLRSPQRVQQLQCHGQQKRLHIL